MPAGRESWSVMALSAVPIQRGPETECTGGPVGQNDPMPSPVQPQPDALPRRAKTVSAVLLGAIIGVPLLVILVPALIIADVVRLNWRFPLVRVLLFGTWYLLWEVRAVLSAAVWWVITGFGRGLDQPRSMDFHRRLQRTWAHSLIGAMGKILRLELDVDGLDNVPPAGCVLLARHASLVDTLLPIHLFGSRGVVFRYVLKTELLMDPALDIIGHRFPNYFVDRSGVDSAGELARITSLASGTGDEELFVIFPEGSRFTTPKRVRALEKLDASDPELAAKAREYITTMPPRLGGPLAAIEAIEGTDVVVLAHTGLEGLAGLKELIRSVPFRHPVRVAIWRVPNSEIPTDRRGRELWLFDLWKQVDDWVVANRAD